MEAAASLDLGDSDEGAGAGNGEDIMAEAVVPGEPEPPPGHEEETEDASMLGHDSLAFEGPPTGPAQGEDENFAAGPESGPAQGEGEANEQQQQEQPAAVVSCKLEPEVEEEEEPADSASAASRQLHQLPLPLVKEEPAQPPPLKKVKLEFDDAPAAGQPDRKRSSLAPIPGPAAVATPCRSALGRTVRSPAFPSGTPRPRPKRNAMADLLTGFPSKGKLTLQPKEEDDDDEDSDLFADLFGSESEREREHEHEGTPRNVKTEGSGSGSSMSAKKRKAPPSSDHQVVEVCIGCKRQYCKSACYFEPRNLVKWNASNGNGYWCYECVRLFSTSYKDRTT